MQNQKLPCCQKKSKRTKHWTQTTKVKQKS
jgi:hypothetical protein